MRVDEFGVKGIRIFIVGQVAALRNPEMTSVLEDNGFAQPTFIYETSSPSEHEYFFDEFLRLGRAPTRGEIGCARSHLAVAETMIKAKTQLAIVLEDDAILPPEALVNLDVSRLVEDKTASVLVLGWDIREFSEGHPKNLLIPPMGTFAYALNLAAAEELHRLHKSSHRGVHVPADWPWSRVLRFRIPMRPVAFHPQETSLHNSTINRPKDNPILAFISLSIAMLLRPKIALARLVRGLRVSGILS